MRLVACDYDAETGITEEYWYWEDGGKGKLTIKRFQDVDHVLTDIRNQFNSHPDKAVYNDVTGGAFKAAEIPMMVLEQWRKEGFDWYKSTDKEKRAKLNDPDWKNLKTRPGKL